MLGRFILWVNQRQGELRSFLDTWQRCNFLKWNNQLVSLRLVLCLKNHTLYLVQLRFLRLFITFFIFRF